MTELELYKFIDNNDIEHSWNGEQCIVWIYIGCDLQEFTKLCKSFLDDDGIAANLQGNYVAFDIVPICDFYGIEPENVFKNNTI